MKIHQQLTAFQHGLEWEVLQVANEASKYYPDDISRAQVYNYLDGRNALPGDMLPAFFYAYGTDADHFFGVGDAPKGREELVKTLVKGYQGLAGFKEFANFIDEGVKALYNGKLLDGKTTRKIAKIAQEGCPPPRPRPTTKFDIHQRVLQFQQTAGLSVKQLITRLQSLTDKKITHTMAYNYLSGRNAVPSGLLMVFFEAFNITPNEFFLIAPDNHAYNVLENLESELIRVQRTLAVWKAYRDKVVMV